MTQADLVIRGGKVVSPDSVIEASVAIKDGAHCRGRRRRGDAAGARDARRQGHARAARRDRRARALPRSRLSAQGGLRQRHGGRGLRRRHHRVRHAEHHPADRHAGNSRGQAQDGGREGPRRFRALCAARRGHHRARAGARQDRHRLQALHGQHLRRDPDARHRRDAGGLRGCRADRQARVAACRDQFDHGAPRAADARSRPHRSAGAHRLAARRWWRSRR